MPTWSVARSASQTGRDHIPPRIFKEMTRLTKQRQKLDQLLTGIGPLNGKKRAAEISELLDSYIPAVGENADPAEKVQYGLHQHQGRE